VAFVRWDGAEIGALYTINVDGSHEQAILGDILQPKSPTWSPDGQKIILAFQHGGLRSPEEICKQYDFDDGVRLPDNIGEITKFRVSGDGISICYIRKEDLKWGLRQVDVATGQFEDLPADPYSFNPAWDPQNPWRVIYDGEKGLIQLDITNNSNWPLTTDRRDTGPVFSPDGKKLALTYKQHDHWEVYTLDLETGERQRLTKPPILTDPQYNSAAPAWSPDGTYLAFLTDRTGRWEIWVMAADGSNQRPLLPPEIQTRLNLAYRGVNERMLNWTE
jgi:TolB protein